MEFTVKRGLWLRGEGSDHSYLLRRSDGKMCCLGFGALSCGLRENNILAATTPGYAARYAGVELVGWIAELVSDTGDCTELCSQLMDVNDTPVNHSLIGGKKLKSEKQREELLAELFLKLDVEVIFED